MTEEGVKVKNLDDHFRDWELEVFGCGYGTGERPVITALAALFTLCAMPGKGGYDYRILEKELTPPVAWLLINVLCHAKIIDYGTSPRFGFLSEEGGALKTYFASMSVGGLMAALERDEDYVECFPNYCNCSDDPARQCHNPFWVEVKQQQPRLQQFGNRKGEGG